MTTPRNRAPRITRPCTHGGIHTHGTRVAYVKDRCRCEDCTTASRIVEQKRRRARLYGIDAGLADAQPIRDHLAILSEAGVGYKRASELAGVSLTVVQTILYHHPDRPHAGPAKRVKRDTAEKLLAVQPVLENARDHTPVQSRGAARRIQALVARGWSQAKLAERASQQLTKGVKVFVTGDLDTQEWEQDGQKRSAPALTIRRFEVIPRSDAVAQSSPRPSTANAQGEGWGAHNTASPVNNGQWGHGTGGGQAVTSSDPIPW